MPQKWTYPDEYYTKKGTLKKTFRKKANEYRKIHNPDGSIVKLKPSDAEIVAEDFTKELTDNVISDWVSNLSAEERPLGFLDLPVEYDDIFLDHYVFDNSGRVLTHETCKKMRDYCELYPRKCYLEREFLEKYVRTCQIIAKTGLFMDRFYKTPINIINNEGRMTPWRGRSFISRNLSADQLIQKLIPKTQMPRDAKEILINIMSNFPIITGGEIMNWDYILGHKTTFKNRFNRVVEILHGDRELFERVIQMWRHHMAIETTKTPIEIEHIIRRFIKALYY